MGAFSVEQLVPPWKLGLLIPIASVRSVTEAPSCP